MWSPDRFNLARSGRGLKDGNDYGKAFGRMFTIGSIRSGARGAGARTRGGARRCRGTGAPRLDGAARVCLPGYYLESVESYRRAPVRPIDEVVRIFGDRARKYHSSVVVGIAEPVGDRLSNSAYVFDTQGRVLARPPRAFCGTLTESGSSRAAPTQRSTCPLSRRGVFCADGRMPEITRVLGVKGSRLLIDSTAWVTGGGDRATLSKQSQFEYMIPTRAIENGAWIAVANKVGVEAESVVYCGRSCVASPLASMSRRRA